jgi:hypothetical protein
LLDLSYNNPMITILLPSPRSACTLRFQLKHYVT